jgi:tRNA (cytidine/uridine-2'-O-)-methyltransferase
MSAFLNVVLYQPQIAPNTGNIIRLCANISADLHLIKPYGFNLDEKNVKRAGLDYHDLAKIFEYNSFSCFLQKIRHADNVYSISTSGKIIYSDIKFTKHSYFIFGSETKGLPSDIKDGFECLTIPMRAKSRSLNLSNSVAIVLYEAWRQLGFN